MLIRVRLFFVLASLSGYPLCVAQTFDEAKFDSLVAKIEGDVLELAKTVELAYSTRCDPKHLSSCEGNNYDHCLSALPDQTCPGGVDLDTPECSGREGSTCSALYSYTSSSVTLPRDLAKGTNSNPTDPKVVETVCFTKELDTYFVNKRNQDEDFWNTLGQQPSSMHFGSTSGAYRLYPARIYSSCGEYDPRLRPWYVAASSGPKNVVLVLDKSGSMKSDNKIGLMKQAAKRIIQATTVSDRIVVVAFDDEIEAITDKGSVFIATAENKQRLQDQIDSLEARGGTNFFDAFRTAFDAVDESSREELTVNCNTAIIFLTDGIMTGPPGKTEQDVVQLVQDRIAQAKTTMGNPVYLFTYSISGGNQKLGTFPAELACAVETGVYAEIAFAEEIVESLSEYYKFFALGLGSDVNQNFVAWVEPYKWIPGDAIGTTVSAPVYDRTKQPHLFLGVVGVDFTLKSLDAALGVTNSSDQESFRRVVQRSTARCPKLRFSTCELESYRMQGTAGEGALCTNNCTADDFVQVTEQQCSGISDYPSDLWDNTDNKGISFIESVCCVVGENIPNPVCIRDFDGSQPGFGGPLMIAFIAVGCAVVTAAAAFVWRRSKLQSHETSPVDGPTPPPFAPTAPVPPYMAQPVQAYAVTDLPETGTSSPRDNSTGF